MKKYLPAFLLQFPLILAHFHLKHFHFRMTFHKLLNAICDLHDYLVCKMPKGTLEVEVKVKTTWGKYTLVQNTHTRMERYYTWEKAHKDYIKSRKGRIPHKAASVHTVENSSDIDTPTDLEFRNPPHILEGEVKHETNFSGKYCEYCNRCKETHCWCFTSDWEEGLDANNPNSSVEILPSPTAKKPPAGWSKSRCRVIKKTDTTGPPSPREEMNTDSGTSMH